MKRDIDIIDVNDIVGKKIGKLFIESYSHDRIDIVNNNNKYGSNRRHRYLYNCLCDCGNRKVIRRDSLITGLSKSCGCTRKVKAKAKRYL